MCDEGMWELGLFSSKNSTVTYGDFFFHQMVPLSVNRGAFYSSLGSSS